MPQPQALFGPDLRNALVAMVKKRVPESEVEDIVQATMTDAFTSPHAPPDAESFRRWIFGVAKNKVVDYHRRAGRETFEMPEVAGNAAPHQEADMLRWAEKHIPPGAENKATLEWMLREGDGEKLESIAETEHLPAPRVRQRVSRLRRHLKEHWQKEVAVLAALGVLITGILLFLHRKPSDQPIANEDVARAEELRKGAAEKCAAHEWKPCLDKLDDAKRLDPAGDSQPAPQQMRNDATKALSAPPPVDSTTLNNNITPPPDPTTLAKEADAQQAEILKQLANAPRKDGNSDIPPVDLSATKLGPKGGKVSPKPLGTDFTPTPTAAPVGSGFATKSAPAKTKRVQASKPPQPSKSGGVDVMDSSLFLPGDPIKPGRK
jgi:DNA-directed RNA polymerase specialized sigma24 family protein